MKLLIIGIDGGDSRIFNSLEMPFFKNLIGGMESLHIEEDLWSRGWVEILSGKTGMDTGAFYEKPMLDGSLNFTQKFNSLSYLKTKGIIPLWSLINSHSKTVGFMNIPTTSPAQKVDGFIIGGAGGGISSSEKYGIPLGLCYPQNIEYDLKKNKYIMDTRFKASNIKNMDKWFSTLNEMQKNRTNSFISLVNNNKIDIGFIAYMSTQREQYLAMSEIESLMKHGVRNKHQKKIKELYMQLDDCIKKLILEIKPERIMFVSDHGSNPDYSQSTSMLF